MRLLDRYAAREMLIPLLIGTCAVTLMLIGNLLFNYARQLFAFRAPLVSVFQLAFYHAPALMALSLPVGCAVAVSLAVNRLARDSEITVMRMAGISLRRIFLPMILFGLVVSGVNFWLTEKVAPQAEREFNRLLTRILFLQSAPTSANNVVMRSGRYTVAIGSVRRQGDFALLTDIALLENLAEGGWIVVRAEDGIYGGGRWDLTRPTIHFYHKNGDVFDVKVGEMEPIALKPQIQDFFSSPVRPEELTRAELKKQIDRERELGIVTRGKELSYHLKIAMPVACLIMALISPAISLRLARSGSFVGVLIAIVLAFVYWNTLLLAQLVGEQGYLPPLLAAWSPNILFGLAGLWLIARAE